MELSVREAATLLGRSPRTVRAQAARGELPAVKRGRSWFIRQQDLPLTEPQRRAVQARADEVRACLDEALPGRAASTPGDRRRTLADLDAFRIGADLLGAMRAVQPTPGGALGAARCLEEALLCLGESVQLYEREHKLEAVERARRSLGRASAHLLIGESAHAAVQQWLLVLDTELGPRVAGWARWISALRGRRRG